jgi:hypothetical protein
MPSWIAGGGTNQGAADIGRHAQLSFPVDCIFDEQCDDGIACTDNVCGDEGRCVYVPSEGFCPSDGVFCNGPEICHVDLGCVASGNPCADPDACNEDESRCACDPPLVTARGPRYLGVSPQPPDSLTPVALVVTPDCRGGVPRYVGTPDAGLLEEPVTLSLLVDDPENGDHLTPGLWGGTTYVTGIDVVPGIGYYVQADCGLPGIPSLSDPAYVVTQIWGDVMGRPSAEGTAPPNGVVDVLDMTAAVDGFRQLLTALPLYVLDLLGCIPDRVVTIVDIGATVDAFRGLSYADSSLCPTPCP